jgi:hypothetical protein
MMSAMTVPAIHHAEIWLASNMASMSFWLTSPSSLPYWDALEIVSLVFVWVGVWGEYKAERMKSPYNPTNFPALETEKKKVGAFFWRVLLLGLSAEAVASIFIMVISNKEIAELNLENSKLKTKLQQRTINKEKTENFIFLTEKIPKIPIRVAIGANKDEVVSYAWQIRQMLNQAHFPTPDSDTNLAFGIHFDTTAVALPVVIGDTNEWGDVELITDETNDFTKFYYLAMQKTNGFVRYTIPAGDTNDMYGALINAFSQINVKISWYCKPEWVNPNHCEIYIRQKPQ